MLMECEHFKHWHTNGLNASAAHVYDLCRGSTVYAALWAAP